MKTTFKFAVAAFALSILSGCGAGDAPAGMSGEDAAAAVAAMPPEQKIRAIANSPMPEAKKQEEYAKIEAASGVKASEVLGAGGPPRRGG